MEEFIKDRNDAFTSGDMNKIKEYCTKYNINIPEDEKTFLAGVHKAICNLFLLPDSPITIEQYNNLQNNNQNSNVIEYVVKSGDTLYKIAQDYNITVDELKNLNNLSSNTLSVGQLLKIPSPISEPETYTVKKGDSLYSIAQEFNTTVDILKKLILKLAKSFLNLRKQQGKIL